MDKITGLQLRQTNNDTYAVPIGVWAQNVLWDQSSNLTDIVGDLDNLTTVNKGTLVAAINEAATTGSGEGGSGGSSTLAGLTDTDISSEQDGQVLTYDGTSHKWVNRTPLGGSVEIEVDNELSGTSENPVQNKVINTAIEAHGLRLTALEAESGGGDGTGGLPAAFSLAMYNMLNHLTGTFDDGHGQDYINAVITAMGYDDGGNDPDPSGGDDERTLPEQYQEVEYVQSNGGVFFDTGISAGALPVKIELGIFKTTQASSEQAIVIAKSATNSTAWEIGYSGTANVLFAYSSSSARVTNSVVYGNKLDVVARFNTSSPYKQLEVTADGSTVTAEDTGVNDASAGYTTSYIRFFGATSQTNRASCKMYYCKIYNAENELVLDMVPCRLKTSQYGGLYDFVSGTYFQSTTSTHLVPGPDITTEGGNE